VSGWRSRFSLYFGRVPSLPAAGERWRARLPLPKGWWPDGLSHQEAPQAYGEEEAPQAAEEDADPAQEQEVVRCGSCGRVEDVPATSRLAARGTVCPVCGLPAMVARVPADDGPMTRMSVRRWFQC